MPEIWLLVVSAAVIGRSEHMRKVAVDEQAWITATGYKKNVLLTGDDLHSAGALVQLVTIEAGETIPDHYHEASIEVYYVLQGTCQLFVNDDKVLLQPGSCLLMEPGDVHRLHNHGSQRFLLLVLKTNARNADTYWHSGASEQQVC